MAAQLITRNAKGKLVIKNDTDPTAFDRPTVYRSTAVSTLSIKDGVFIETDHEGGGSRKLFAATN